MSLVENLWNSGRYVNGQMEYKSDVVTLVKELEQLAKEQGLTISRWQTNRGHWGCTVTWAAHKGERTGMSADLPDDALVVKFEGLEGKTKRCKAYRALEQLFNQVADLHIESVREG